VRTRSLSLVHRCVWCGMLSNVTKSADVLRGNTQHQDLWLEVEKETAHWHPGLPPPKEVQYEVRYGKWLNDQERREELERLATVRQQKINWYRSEPCRSLTSAKSGQTKAERKSARDRLTKVPKHMQPVDKVKTGKGHLLLATNEPAPMSISPPRTPKSRAAVSSPGTGGETRIKKTQFQGLTMRDFYTGDWAPSFEYKPAKQSHPWTNLEGFAQSTRTLERRKMDPFADINSFQGNATSAKNTLDHSAHVRPLDAKGMLGAGPVQKWKETLREDFANDNDNFSSNQHDAMLDALRQAMGKNDNFSSVQ